MPEISCLIDMFNAEQILILSDGTKAKMSLNEMLKTLPELCFSSNCNKIHFFGEEENYINGLVKLLQTNLLFKEQNIEIEVN